jgi:hypothetical protein
LLRKDFFCSPPVASKTGKKGTEKYFFRVKSFIFHPEIALSKKVINRQKPPFPVLFRVDLANLKTAKNKPRKKRLTSKTLCFL